MLADEWRCVSVQSDLVANVWKVEALEVLGRVVRVVQLPQRRAVHDMIRLEARYFPFEDMLWKQSQPCDYARAHRAKPCVA
jgi:hypothetical protein